MSKRAKKIKIILIVLAILYVSSYFFISRTSLKYAKADGIDAFFYVPCSIHQLIRSQTLLRVHYFGIVFYYPIWWIDHLLGGPSYSYFTPLDAVGAPK